MSINPADKPFGRIAHPDIYDVGTNILLADGSEGMTEIVLSDGINGYTLAAILYGIQQRLTATMKAANKAKACKSACFIAGTLVLCRDENGEECRKPIEEIEVGDMVWT